MKQLTYIIIALASVTASAGPKQKREAKKHIERATKLHAESKFEESLVELQAAYKLDPQVDLIFAIGQTYSKLGKCDEASTHFKQFAAKKKSAEIDKVAADAIAACVPAAPPPPPEPPPPPPEPPPPVHEAEPPPPPPTPPPAHEPSPFAPAPVAAEPARPAETPHASAWYRDTLGDGLVVAGIASGVAGVILYQKARTDLDDAEHAGSLAQYNQLVDDAHSTRTISIVLVGGGAVFVGAGLAHYAFHGRAESHGVVVAPARGGGIVTWTGGF